MPLRISSSHSFTWASVEAVNLTRRLVMRTAAPPGIIAKEHLPRLQSEMEARAGVDVLQVGEGMFIPTHAIAHVFVDERVVELLSEGSVEIEPAFADTVRAFCAKRALENHGT